MGDKFMKLIIIPPYRRVGVNYSPTEGHFLVNKLVDNMRKKGQLQGVEIDIDEGHLTEHTAESRDAEVSANITVGFLKRVKECSQTGKYDAIVTSGGIDLGHFAARMISKIPIAYSVHSSVHIASLIGDRFTMIDLTDPIGLLSRHSVQNYGLSNKLASVRHVSRSSPYAAGLIQKYKKEERIAVPELKKLIGDVVAQCITAIEKDRVDSLILGCPHLQCLEDEVREGLDDSGYSEIQLICGLLAAVEMAKAMVNMKLIQAPRAYPSDGLRAKPEFR
jgi:allantoin racemase